MKSEPYWKLRRWTFNKETSTYVCDHSDWGTVDPTCAICGNILDHPTRTIRQHGEVVAWEVDCHRCPGVARTKNPTRHKIFND